MKEIALAITCVLGWAGLVAFSLLRLFGVIEVDGHLALTVTLALIPLSISMPWAVEAAAQQVPAPALALVAVAAILAPMSLLDMGERARDRITRKDPVA